MSDIVVVDANLALKWVLLEEDSHASMLLLDKWTNEGKTVIAPALFAYEVTNILYRQSVTGKLTYDESRRGLEKLFSLEIQLKFSPYEEQCECWTADKRLWTAVKRELNWVRWLGELSS
jgi:predicted nucleic acid-binding protein